MTLPLPTAAGRPDPRLSVRRARLGWPAPLFCGMKEHHGFGVPARGWFELAHRGAVRRVGPGVLALARPGEVYRELRRGPEAALDFVAIDTAEIGAARASAFPRCTDALGPVVLDVADPRARALLALHRRVHAPEDGLAADVVLTEAACVLATLTSATDPARVRERPAIRRARAYLLERLAQPVRLDELADHVGLDKYRLVRAFRAEVGVPPYEYLTHARIARARALLRRGSSPAKVAALLGYCDQSQLHRHFVRIVGTSPGRYARSATSASSSEVAVARGPDVTQE